MTLGKYAKDKWLEIILLTVSIIISSVLLYVAGTKIIFIVFVQFLFVVAFITGFIYDFWQRKKHYGTILNVLEKLSQKSLLSELITPGYFSDANIIYAILRRSNKYMNDRIAEVEATNREYQEYIELWVHEVKTPLASASLIIENNKNETTARIGEEIYKINNLIEQSLYYARSTSLDRDLKVEEFSTKELCSAALKNYASQIIGVGGSIKFKELGNKVFADKKWCVFVIGQIIANAAKYHGKTPLLLTFSEQRIGDRVALLVQDNGIGVPQSDLPRIFDKGFTGTNGRKYGKSTGIGLYLCKKLCIEMNIELTANSDEVSGTVLCLTFPRNKFVNLDTH